MKKYHPNQAPDPEEWNALDDSERLIIIEDYHRRKRIHMPNQVLHATIHAVVENQIAMGDEFIAAETLDRLMSEGLDRHEAIHAIGSVLAEHIYGMLSGDMQELTINQYLSRLKDLTAEKWREMGNEGD